MQLVIQKRVAMRSNRRTYFESQVLDLGIFAFLPFWHLKHGRIWKKIYCATVYNMLRVVLGAKAPF